MVELHLHLDGSLEPDDILYLADLSGENLPTRDKETLRGFLTVDKNCKSLNEYLSKFTLPLTVLQTSDCIKEAVYRVLERQAKNGIVYTELRFAPCLHTKKGLSQKEVVKASVEGLRKALTEFDTEARLILCCMRGFDEKTNLETIDVAYTFSGCGVVAVDLAGSEADNPTELYYDIFKYAKNKGIPFTIHAGEAADFNSVAKAIDFGAVRIGHGIHSAESESLLEVLAEKKTVLETCFTSNLQTKAIKNAYDFPLKKLIDMGIPATVCTDNSTVSGTNLKNEYSTLKKTFGFSDEYLLELCKNAASGIFACNNTKSKIYAKIESGFIRWLNG